MKKFLSLLAVVFTLGLSTVAMDAEAAKRMGSGKSLGMQRQQATPDKSPGAAPTQAAATPAAAGAAGAAAAPKSSWMGPIAGLWPPAWASRPWPRTWALAKSSPRC